MLRRSSQTSARLPRSPPQPNAGSRIRERGERAHVAGAVELLSGAHGEHVRLEQERIGFGWVKAALARLPL